jgi:hypothetical protein
LTENLSQGKSDSYHGTGPFGFFLLRHVSPAQKKGRVRWIDEKNWAYDFERDLPAGVSCEFTLHWS